MDSDELKIMQIAIIVLLLCSVALQVGMSFYDVDRVRVGRLRGGTRTARNKKKKE